MEMNRYTECPDGSSSLRYDPRYFVHKTDQISSPNTFSEWDMLKMNGVAEILLDNSMDK